MNPEFFKNLFESPHGWKNAIFHFSFLQHSGELSDCRRNRQEKRPTNIILLGRASTEKQSGTRPKKLATTDRSSLSSHVAYHHDL